MPTWVLHFTGEDWELSGMRYRLQLAVLQTDCLGMGLETSITREARSIRVVTEVDGWKTDFTAELPKRAVVESYFSNEHMLIHKHVHYDVWWHLVKDLCLTSRRGDAEGVIGIVQKLRMLCVDQAAVVFWRLLPAHLCRQIGMLAGGTQGGCDYAIHYCQTQPAALSALLSEGDVSNRYVRDNEWSFFVSADKVKASGCCLEHFHEVAGANTMLIDQKVYVNKVMCAMFGVPADIQKCPYLRTDHEPIVFNDMIIG